MAHSSPKSSDQLDEILSDPPTRVVESLQQTAGDFAVLGAGGKLGYHLCRMLRRALDQLDGDRDGPDPHRGGRRRVWAVSRFGRPETRAAFDRAGVETVSADLSDPAALAELPDAPNVFFLAGVKFGTTGDPDLLHRMNVAMPAQVAQRYRAARIVALSTGCVYSFTSPDSGGSTEQSPTDPPGDYAASCLGRERAFVDASDRFGTRSVLVRLNYAVELRYGVLVDIAQRVYAGQPIDVEMGHVNLIWQRDAIDHVIQCLPHAASPPMIMNVTGSEVLRVRDLAEAFGRRLGRPAEVVGREAPTAWLNNPARAHALFGAPQTDLQQMIDWVADWIERGGETLDKPTHFENREGSY